MADKKSNDTKKPKGSTQKKSDVAVKSKSKSKKTKVTVPPLPEGYVPRLKNNYMKQVTPKLLKQFGYSNPMLLPKLDKIVLNVGNGMLHQDAKLAESVVHELTLISGQKPVLTKARLSVANFKLRQGMVVGCKVTLRGFNMYEFFDRLISIVIPRIRDFQPNKELPASSFFRPCFCRL